MINIETDILLHIFIPVLLLSFCSGILLIGSLLYLFVYIFEKKRLFLTILILGTLGFIFTLSDVLVIIFSVVKNPGPALFLHRVEALSALFFSFALPMLLSDMLELGKNFKTFNAVLYKTLFIISSIILITSLVIPELFISASKPAGILITPWNLGRGTPGILYRLRDFLIFYSVLYTFFSIIADIIVNKRVRYLGLILLGIIIGIISGAFDIIQGMMELEKGLFSSRIYSYFGLGFTIFILLSMISVLRRFLDQTRDIENAKKIESLGLFAGGIAHDFNNILTGILGNTSLLMTHPHKNISDGETLIDIEKAVYRAKTLTMQLLTFSRGGTPVKDIASIKNIVEETARFILSGSGIKLHINYDRNLLDADVDAGQISQVIQNLVLNAKEAQDEKEGSIEIKIENIRMLQPLIKNTKLSDYIKIEIKDYGNGINEQALPYIFDPYFSTKGSGTGLGLSVSHSIVRKHGGDITVRSKKGEGTTFTIFLPATHKKKNIYQTSESAGKQLRGRILIMDDDQYLLPMFKKMLEHIGLTALCVSDGESAIAEFIKAKNSKNPFDAIIMDLTISGGMGGVKTSREIREIDKSIPLIVASGYCDDPVMSDYKCYGFNERLFKPFSLEDLKKTIAAIIKN